MKQDNDILWRARNMLANNAMSELYSATRELIDSYGVDGAEIFLQAQMKFVQDVREAEIKDGVEYGDDV